MNNITIFPKIFKEEKLTARDVLVRDEHGIPVRGDRHNLIVSEKFKVIATKLACTHCKVTTEECNISIHGTCSGIIFEKYEQMKAEGLL